MALRHKKMVFGETRMAQKLKVRLGKILGDSHGLRVLLEQCSESGVREGSKQVVSGADFVCRHWYHVSLV